ILIFRVAKIKIAALLFCLLSLDKKLKEDVDRLFTPIHVLSKVFHKEKRNEKHKGRINYFLCSS
ncbi:MAG: hypothetical protein II339_00705, partial [Spirochaetales bacterium]|nr:hypothetical protein [Spirochaetales bacterium]